MKAHHYDPGLWVDGEYNGWPEPVIVHGFLYGKHDDMTDFDQHGNGVLAIIEMREGDLMARPLSEIRTRGTAAQEVARENLGVEVDVVEHEPPITITADMPAGPVDEAEQPA